MNLNNTTNYYVVMSDGKEYPSKELLDILFVVSLVAIWLIGTIVSWVLGWYCDARGGLTSNPFGRAWEASCAIQEDTRRLRGALWDHWFGESYEDIHETHELPSYNNVIQQPPSYNHVIYVDSTAEVDLPDYLEAFSKMDASALATYIGS